MTKAAPMLIASGVLLMLAFSLTAQTNSLVGPELLNTPSIFIPDEAELSGLGGLVRVRLSIDENGNSTSVEQVTGPDWTCPQVNRRDVVAMREAAMKAAMLAKFKPMTHNGTPIRSSISLNFDFPAGETSEAKTISHGRGTSPIETAGSAIAVKRNERSAASNAIPRAKQPRQISAGVLNGKALSLVKPRWPAAVHETGGTVTVSVLIDTNGEVFSAETVSGHPLFRHAARSGACESTFRPTTLSSGEPVRVYGTIVYNFRKD